MTLFTVTQEDVDDDRIEDVTPFLHVYSTLEAAQQAIEEAYHAICDELGVAGDDREELTWNGLANAYSDVVSSHWRITECELK